MSWAARGALLQDIKAQGKLVVDLKLMPRDAAPAEKRAEEAEPEPGQRGSRGDVGYPTYHHRQLKYPEACAADLFLPSFSAHADGERRGLHRIGGWRPKGLGETRLEVPSVRRGTSAFAVGMLRDIERERKKVSRAGGLRCVPPRAALGDRR